MHGVLVDHDDLYEPMAENEADFQPSIFPLLFQENIEISRASSALEREISARQRASSALELVPELKKLEIEDGYQHISADTREPSLTFTSPQTINSSTSIQVWVQTQRKHRILGWV